MNISLDRSHVGKRLLLRETLDERLFHEVKLLEMSPSGRRIKLRFSTGEKLWCDVGTYVVEEILEERKKRPRVKKRKRTTKR